MSKPARFVARTKSIIDRRLSNGAAILFNLLDDEANGNPTFSVSQSKLAGLMGCTVRETRNRIRELELTGYLTTRRTGRLSAFEMLWSRQEQAFRSDRNKRSDQIGTEFPIYPYMQEEVKEERLTPYGEDKTQNPDCPQCFGIGYVLRQRVIRGQGITERQMCGCGAGKVRQTA